MQKLFDKLSAFGLSHLVCFWILDFLLHRPSKNKSQRLPLQYPDAQHKVDSSLHSCFAFSPVIVSAHGTIQIMKNVNDTTAAGLIASNESAYNQEVEYLTAWCSENGLQLNVSKTKEMMVDFRRKRGPAEPLTINGEAIEQADHFGFLGPTIANDLSWETTQC